VFDRLEVLAVALVAVVSLEVALAEVGKMV